MSIKLYKKGRGVNLHYQKFNHAMNSKNNEKKFWDCVNSNCLSRISMFTETLFEFMFSETLFIFIFTETIWVYVFWDFFSILCSLVLCHLWIHPQDPRRTPVSDFKVYLPAYLLGKKDLYLCTSLSNTTSPLTILFGNGIPQKFSFNFRQPKMNVDGIYYVPQSYYCQKFWASNCNVKFSMSIWSQIFVH